MNPLINPHTLHTRLGPLLRPFSLPYALLMAGRRALYRKGVRASFPPACPCVSVGNIGWGGSGKTPFTAWLLGWARARGVRAAVLTRGYGGRPGPEPLLVRGDTPPERSGDEALMLARLFPEAAVLAFPKRSASARVAAASLRPDLFILDDGMQHLAMGRHADIVLLRPQDLRDEWNRVIPSGSWREGASALGAATVFAVRADEEDFAALLPAARARLAPFGRPLYSFSLLPIGLCSLSGEAADPDAYRDRPYALLSGVGDPAQVERSAVRFFGRPPVRHFAFGDHHRYGEADVRAVQAACGEARFLVCTAKDAVKLAAIAALPGEPPIRVLETQPRFGPSLFTDTPFPAWWERWWDRHKGQIS